jgi:hypothetical protein
MNASSRQNNLKRVKSMSRIMDSQFEGPFGIRFGVDAIIGLIPIFGDLFTSLFSAYIIFEAARAGCSPIVLIRMSMNIMLENIVGLLPVAGNIFDIFWRSNNKNVELFERSMNSPQKTARTSALVVGGVVFSIFAVIFGFFVAAYYLTQAVWNLIANT